MKKFLISCGMLLALGAQSLMAVPANRNLVHTLVQPDGTTVELRLVGDETAHCFVTEDGYPVIEDSDGFYRYATLDASGHAVSSGVKPTSLALRSNAEKHFVSTLDASTIRTQVLTPRAEASRILRSRQAMKAPAAAKENTSSGIGLFDVKFPAKGEVNSLVILVEYNNKKFSMDDPHDYFSRHLNEEGFSDHGATGSCRDYFIESSMGQFKPTFDTYGPVELPHPYSYYGGNDWSGNDQRAEDMVIDACNMLDSIIDFSAYDLDNNGSVDNIFIIYAGLGEANGGSSSTVWPHQWDLSYAGKSLKLDGVNINHYGCANELSGGDPDGIGTFVHEFSHVMGLPDLYTTDYGSATSLTPGSWSVLDYGPYNNDGRTPPAYSIFERNALGWIEPIVLDGEDSITLEDIRTSNQGAIALTNKDNEFFLFENRQQQGSDKYLPGHGMLIWHIDFNQSKWSGNAVNNTSSHQYVDIEEANGRADNNSSIVMAGYPFPGTNKVTSFTDDTKPNMLTWSGASLGLPITNIAEKSGVITFDVCGGKFDLTAPVVRVSDVNAGGFTIEWDARQSATHYMVEIYQKAFGEKANAQEYKVTEPSLTLTRLQPESYYYAVVTAYKDDAPTAASDELEILTSPYDFTLAIPEATAAEGICDNAFTATWKEVKGAEGYLLSVITTSGNAQATESTDFGSGAKLSLPEGWTSTSSAVYTGAIYCGKAAPALKFDKDQATLQTALYSGDITSLKFWTRINANGKPSPNYLTIQGRGAEGDEWKEITTITDIDYTSNGQTVELTDFEPGVHQLRLVYTKQSTGNLAIDDMELVYGGIVEEVYMDYDAKPVGNVTSHTVAVQTLPSGVYPTEFAYTVKAIDAIGRTSLESDPISVDIRTEGIQGPATDLDPEATVEYYNLQGIRISAPTAPGIYIRRQGAATFVERR